MEDKLKDLDNKEKKVDLKINWGKRKEMRINLRNNEQLELIGKVIERVYLGRIVSKSIGTDEGTA